MFHVLFFGGVLPLLVSSSPLLPWLLIICHLSDITTLYQGRYLGMRGIGWVPKLEILFLLSRSLQ